MVGYLLAQECTCTRSDRRAAGDRGRQRPNLFSNRSVDGEFLCVGVARGIGSIVCRGMTAAIEIEGLRKVYRRRGRDVNAVDGLDLSVPEGGVFGFLGPNGSGKTTTIRSLLGLVRATSGHMSILGCTDA